MRPIVVLGAGSWGTALANHFARGGSQSSVLVNGLIHESSRARSAQYCS